jgi:hypothetical protein
MPSSIPDPRVQVDRANPAGTFVWRADSTNDVGNCVALEEELARIEDFVASGGAVLELCA